MNSICPVNFFRTTDTTDTTDATIWKPGLNESHKRDHEFFEKLAEKEAEREMKSQQMMFSMVKEVAKIFKGE